jgi:hypothetical protein
MLKKIIFVGALAVASLVSFKIGGSHPGLNAPTPARACQDGTANPWCEATNSCC